MKACGGRGRKGARMLELSFVSDIIARLFADVQL